MRTLIVKISIAVLTILGLVLIGVYFYNTNQHVVIKNKSRYFNISLSDTSKLFECVSTVYKKESEYLNQPHRKPLSKIEIMFTEDPDLIEESAAYPYPLGTETKVDRSEPGKIKLRTYIAQDMKSKIKTNKINSFVYSIMIQHINQSFPKQLQEFGCLYEEMLKAYNPDNKSALRITEKL